MKMRKLDCAPAPTKGFTLIELIVSVLVFSVIMTISLSFLQVQNKGFKKGLDYMSTLQTLRYSIGTLEQDIQTAGTNLVAGQPEVVYAGENVVAFNSDYATRAQHDPFAVFYDPDLEDRVAQTMTRSQRRMIPETSFEYPDSTYLNGAGLPGPAETLIFFLVPDDDTERSDDFALFRQVNAEEPQLVSNQILRVDGMPFFRYMRDGDLGVDSIPDNLLPLAHTVAVHESAADTGRIALVDSIRAVRITFAATNGKEGELERTSQVTRIVRMPNMGFGMLDICGSPPLLGTGLNATLGSDPETGDPFVRLAWGQATDEDGGEDDIVRYVIWRRTPGVSDWEEPFLSIPAGEDSYTYDDADLVANTSYQYALATQDCTPTLSKNTTSATVTTPN